MTVGANSSRTKQRILKGSPEFQPEIMVDRRVRVSPLLRRRGVTKTAQMELLADRSAGEWGWAQVALPKPVGREKLHLAGHAPSRLAGYCQHGWALGFRPLCEA